MKSMLVFLITAVVFAIPAKADDLFEVSVGRDFILESEYLLDDWGDGWTIGGTYLPGNLRPLQPVISISHTWLDKDGGRTFDLWGATVDMPPLIGPGRHVFRSPSRSNLVQADIASRYYPQFLSDRVFLTLPFAGITYVNIETEIEVVDIDESGEIVSSVTYEGGRDYASLHAGFGFGFQIHVNPRYTIVFEQRFIWSSVDDSGIRTALTTLSLQID